MKPGPYATIGSTAASAVAEPSPEVIRKIIEVIKTVRYGSVEVVIQDARVVQIERKEKFRFQKP